MRRFFHYHGMTLRPPKFQATDPRRTRDMREAFQTALRELVIEGVKSGWREAEAAMALADAADDYVMFLSERPRRSRVAANSN
jgi:hypothetical protein